MPMRKMAQRELAALFALLSHPLRLALLSALRDGERDVGSLVAATAAPQTAVSQALARLRAARLVQERRQGRHVFYRLTVATLPGWIDAGYAMLADETAHLVRLHDALTTAQQPPPASSSPSTAPAPPKPSVAAE
jgi:DNA-binding transcriptional ArsR family regulator